MVICCCVTIYTFYVERRCFYIWFLFYIGIGGSDRTQRQAAAAIAHRAVGPGTGKPVIDVPTVADVGPGFGTE